MKLKALIAAAVGAIALVLPAVAHADVTTKLGVSASPKTFYPYLHDGYRDKVTATYSGQVDIPNADAEASYPDCWNSTTDQIRVTIQSVVENSNGQVIRHLSAKTTSAWDTNFGYDSTWVDIDLAVAWDGKKDNGSLVKSGYFRIVGDSELSCLGNPQGVTAETQVGNIHATTGYLTVKHTLRKQGRYAYSHSGCNSRPDGWNWWLDSNFGCSDTVTYRFAVPSSGTHLGGGIYAPYKQGPFYTSLSRSGGNAYLKVRAASGSYGDVQSAHVSYSTKRKV